MGERKNSLAFRNAEGLRHRNVDDERRAEKLKCEHENYELKWSGERDMEDYKNECKKERKNSLAFRNAEGLRHRNVDDERRSENKLSFWKLNYCSIISAIYLSYIIQI